MHYLCRWKKKTWIGLHIVDRQKGIRVSYPISVHSHEHKEVFKVYEKPKDKYPQNLSFENQREEVKTMKEYYRGNMPIFLFTKIIKVVH